MAMSLHQAMNVWRAYASHAPEAIESAYDRLRRCVLEALRRAGSRVPAEEREDMAQRILVRILNQRPGFASGGAPGPTADEDTRQEHQVSDYLGTAAVNAVRDYARKKKVHKEAELRDPARAVEEGGGGPAEATERAWAEALRQEAVEPFADREIDGLACLLPTLDAEFDALLAEKAREREARRAGVGKAFLRALDVLRAHKLDPEGDNLGPNGLRTAARHRERLLTELGRSLSDAHTHAHYFLSRFPTCAGPEVGGDLRESQWAVLRRYESCKLHAEADGASVDDTSEAYARLEVFYRIARHRYCSYDTQKSFAPDPAAVARPPGQRT